MVQVKHHTKREKGKEIHQTRKTATAIVQSRHAARAATRRYDTAAASREMRIRVRQTDAHASKGATHVLRDGDEADADEREGAASVAAGPGEGRRSDPSRGSEAKHAHA